MLLERWEGQYIGEEEGITLEMFEKKHTYTYIF